MKNKVGLTHAAVKIRNLNLEKAMNTGYIS